MPGDGAAPGDGAEPGSDAAPGHDAAPGDDVLPGEGYLGLKLAGGLEASPEAAGGVGREPTEPTTPSVSEPSTQEDLRLLLPPAPEDQDGQPCTSREDSRSVKVKEQEPRVGAGTYAALLAAALLALACGLVGALVREFFRGPQLSFSCSQVFSPLPFTVTTTTATTTTPYYDDWLFGGLPTLTSTTMTTATWTTTTWTTTPMRMPAETWAAVAAGDPSGGRVHLPWSPPLHPESEVAAEETSAFHWRLRRLQAAAAGAASSIDNIQEGDLLFVHVPESSASPLAKALQASGRVTLDWINQHGTRVIRADTVSHVALVVSTGSVGQSLSVLEAVESGVRIQPLKAFFSSYPSTAKFYHGFVRGVTAEQRHGAVASALTQVGAPFAQDFAPPTGMYKSWYSSSLVDYAYRCALGDDLWATDPARSPFPVGFEPRPLWEAYYTGLSQSVPEPTSGSDPTLLLHSGRVDYAELGPAWAIWVLTEAT